MVYRTTDGGTRLRCRCTSPVRPRGSRFALWKTASASHATIMRHGDDRSRTSVPRQLFKRQLFQDNFQEVCSKTLFPTRRSLVRETYSDGTLFSLGELRIRNSKSHLESDMRAVAGRAVATGAMVDFSVEC